MKIILILFFILSSTLFAFWDDSVPMPEHDIAIGPSLGVVSIDGNSYLSFNLDCSYSYKLLSFSVNGKYNYASDQPAHYALQFEVIGYSIITLGGGFTRWWGDDQAVNGGHLFIGIPIPSPGRFEFNRHTFYHPYTRIHFLGGETIVEFGLYFKIGTWDGGYSKKVLKKKKDDADNLKPFQGE